jgi:phage tail-like protein
VDANGTRFHLLLGYDDWASCSVDGTALREYWGPEIVAGASSVAAVSSPQTNILRDCPPTISPLPGSPPPNDTSGLAYNKEREELTLRPRLFKFIARDTRPDLSNRRGAGRDRYGNWYWIDETSLKIRVCSSGSRTVSDFWSPAIGSRCTKQVRLGEFQARDVAPSPSALTLCGLAVTENHYLVVGVLEPAGLLIFDLHSNGEPRQLLWPKQVKFSPYDMAPRPGGGVWILDCDNDCYWGLDCHFNLIHSEGDQDRAPEEIEDFQPLAAASPPAAGRRTLPRSIALALSLPLAAIHPIAIEALGDGTVLILDRDPDPNQRFSKVYRYDLGKRIGEVSTEAMLTRIETEQASEFRLVGYDFAFVPRHIGEDGSEVADRVYVTADDGNQTYAFSLCQRDRSLEWQPVDEYLPMRLFGGKGLVAAGTDAYYDFTEKWIPVVAQRVPRYVDEATLTTPPLDGLEPDCVWHRLLFDACIPPETRVEIWSRAANELIDLELTAWQQEPGLHLRGEGSELPFIPRHRVLNEQGQSRVADGDGTWEFLFQRARGRFLQVQILLSGNQRTTPHLRALRAYFPRFSYLDHYLPGVYREDEQSASFLERFLANLEGTYTSLEDKIAAVQVLFDVRSAPAETLSWLARWFGIVFDPTWGEATQRMLIRHAMEFFQYRGTIHGLKMALHLTLDPCADENIFALPSTSARRPDSIRIVEKYLTRRTPGRIFGDATDLAGPRRVKLTTRWQPSQGGTNLNKRYDDFIKGQSAAPQPATVFPLNAPSDAAELGRWEEFARATLGFVPSFGPAVERGQWQSFLRSRHASIAALNRAHQTNYDDWPEILLPRDWPANELARKDWQDFLDASQTASGNVVRVLWQEFLARRYRRIGALNQLYGTRWPAFESVALFDLLPPDGEPLKDWYQFEGVAIQMQRTAHRFTVLLPVPMSLAFSPDDHQRRLDLSRRIIELEKPAHTVFDVKFYWAMFRIGEARLELDTLIDQGSRAPQLLPKLILGQGFVGESYLGPPVPEDATDRYILGRNPLVRKPGKERRP